MKFQKGHKFSPGRKKGSKNRMTKELEDALREVESKQGTTLFQHAVERAFKNDQVLTAVLRKFVPDKAQVEEILEGGIDVLVRYAEEKGGKG